MLLSVREVIELSERCFVAAGFPKGIARANAVAVWWTEVYREQGLTALYDLLDPLSELGATEPEVEDRGPPISVLGAGDRSCLVSSSPALDLSCSHADQHGTGVTYGAMTGDDAGTLMLGFLAHRAVERGFVSVVLSVGDQGESTTMLGTSERSCPLLAEVELNAPQRSYIEIADVIENDLHHRCEAPLTRAFLTGETMETYSTADARLLDRLVRQSVEPARAPTSPVDPGFVVVCVDPDNPTYSDGVGRVVDQFVRDNDAEFTQVFTPETVQKRVESLTREGVDVERDVWREIFEFANQVHAPSFEGSELGAGFELNDLDG